MYNAQYISERVECMQQRREEKRSAAHPFEDAAADEPEEQDGDEARAERRDEPRGHCTHMGHDDICCTYIVLYL